MEGIPSATKQCAITLNIVIFGIFGFHWNVLKNLVNNASYCYFKVLGNESRLSDIHIPGQETGGK